MKGFQDSNESESYKPQNDRVDPIVKQQNSLIERLSGKLELARIELARISDKIRMSSDTGSAIERLWAEEEDKMAMISYTERTIAKIKTLMTDEQLDDCEREYRDGLREKVTKIVGDQELEYSANPDLTASEPFRVSEEYFQKVRCGDVELFGDVKFLVEFFDE